MSIEKFLMGYMAALVFIACTTTDVKIGEQVWMAKNMNVDVQGSFCYENKSENCEVYGRLYTWDAAKKVCPAGYHLPSKSDFEVLLNAFKGNAAHREFFTAQPAGRFEKRDSLFLADVKEFDGLGEDAIFWSSTPGEGFDMNDSRESHQVGDEIHEDLMDGIYSLNFFGSTDAILLESTASPEDGLSVRCLRD